MSCPQILFTKQRIKYIIRKIPQRKHDTQDEDTSVHYPKNANDCTVDPLSFFGEAHKHMLHVLMWDYPTVAQNAYIVRFLAVFYMK